MSAYNVNLTTDQINTLLTAINARKTSVSMLIKTAIYDSERERYHKWYNDLTDVEKNLFDATH